MATELDKLAELLNKALPPVPPKMTMRMRPYTDPPFPEPEDGSELFEIVLVPLQAPPRRPDADLSAGQRTYGEPVETDLEVETPDTLERMMEQMKNTGF